MVMEVTVKKKTSKAKTSSSSKKTKGKDRVSGVLGKITKVQQVHRYLKILIYAPSGIGKTRLSATAPDPLIIDCNEQGTMSIRDFENVDVYELAEFEELTNLMYFLKHGDHNYKSVAFDSITSLSEAGMRRVLRENAELDASKDPSMPDRRDWGKLNQLMREFILAARDLEMNIIFTALERIRDDEETEESKSMPSLTPGVMNTALAQVDVVGFLHDAKIKVKGSGKRQPVKRLLVGPSKRYSTKDRLGVFGRYVIRPDLSVMAEAVGNPGETPPPEEDE